MSGAALEAGMCREVPVASGIELTNFAPRFISETVPSWTARVSRRAHELSRGVAKASPQQTVRSLTQAVEAYLVKSFGRGKR